MSERAYSKIPIKADPRVTAELSTCTQCGHPLSGPEYITDAVVTGFRVCKPCNRVYVFAPPESDHG
jgi:hypothetical protein